MIVELFLWLAVVCLILAVLGLIRENLELKEIVKAQDWYYTKVKTIKTEAETEKTVM